MNDFEPKQFGKYYLLRKLAVGGMAEIYVAKTYGVDGFEKQLCIKRILPHCSADKDFVTMLIDEAKLSVLLSHANIVQVYDLGKVGDDYYISMEYIHGVNLRDSMYRCREKKHPIPTDIAVYIASEICKGLDYAHRKTDHNNQPLNIVHRDVSPQNILISYEGEVKIVDFGIAKAAMNISHTMAGILKGKIAYMSSEQAMGKTIDRRTDIFSVGILLYEMLTGTKLFTGESQFEVLKKIRTLRITAESLPDSIPAQLKPIVAKALTHRVEDRYQHAGDLQIELTKYLYSTHIDFSPRKLAAFIGKLFSTEFKNEQNENRREKIIGDITSSVNVEEGAKQLDIVSMNDPLDEISEITDELKEKRRKQLLGDKLYKKTDDDELLSSVTDKHKLAAEGKTKETAKDKASKKKKRQKKKKDKKPRKTILTALIVFLLFITGAYTALKMLPDLKFWERPLKEEITKPIEAATEQVKKYGRVDVTSTPEGAKLYLNGDDTNQTAPSTFDKLDIGKSYTFRAEMENYGPAEQSVHIASAEPIKLNLVLNAPTGTLNLISDPSGAAIMMDDKLTGLTTPATVEKVSIGNDVKITITKPGFEDFEQVLNLTSTKPQRVSIKLDEIKPLLGTVTIDSVPKGASIFLDGTDTNRTTPATIANLEPKQYKISLKLSGYKDWESTTDVEADGTSKMAGNLVRSAETDQIPPESDETPTEEGKETTKPEETTETVTKKPTTDTTDKDEAKKEGDLKITSKPSGAHVYLDRNDTGKITPTTLKDLKIGSTYRVRLDLNGYERAYRKKLMNKESDSVHLTLKKKATAEKPTSTPPPTQTTRPPVDFGPGAKPGKIRVSSSPSGADVYVNGNFIGKTPLTTSSPAGQAVVLISKSGLAKQSRTVTVRPGQTVNVTGVQLNQMYGSITLKSTPPRATVIFDGQMIPAKTPVTIRKVRTDRQHTITVSLSGYQSWSRTFSMNGTSQTFNITLQPR
ncbi:MAG: serine/threonine protein kinase [Deltaproteobacteria bacterium]|nr:serine/threonine protein kinase [Deltaproteobacteria bacterium]